MTNQVMCPRCNVQAVERDAGLVKSIPFHLCPNCKKEVFPENNKEGKVGYYSKDIGLLMPPETPIGYSTDGIDRDPKVKLHAQLANHFGPNPPESMDALYDRKQEALEILTQEMGVEYNKATKIIYELFEEIGWNGINNPGNPNGSDVLGAGGDRKTAPKGERESGNIVYKVTILPSS